MISPASLEVIVTPSKLSRLVATVPLVTLFAEIAPTERVGVTVPSEFVTFTDVSVVLSRFILDASIVFAPIRPASMVPEEIVSAFKLPIFAATIDPF